MNLSTNTIRIITIAIAVFNIIGAILVIIAYRSIMRGRKLLIELLKKNIKNIEWHKDSGTKKAWKSFIESR